MWSAGGGALSITARTQADDPGRQHGLTAAMARLLTPAQTLALLGMGMASRKLIALLHRRCLSRDDIARLAEPDVTATVPQPRHGQSNQ